MRATITADNPFVKGDGTLEESVYLELIAQTAAAVTGFETLGVSNAVADGFLVGAKELKIFGTARVGETLTISFLRHTKFEDFSILNGSVLRGDELLAQGDVTLWENKGTKS